VKRKTMSRHSAAVRCVVLFLVSMTGCAPALESGARSATKGVAGGAAQFLGEPQNRQVLADTLGSPEMQRTVQEFAASVTRGVLEAATSNGGDEQSAAAARLAGAVTRSAVDAVLAEVTTAANEQRLQELAALTGEAVSRGALRAMAAEMPEDVTPAMAGIVRGAIGPGLRSAFTDPDIRAAVGATAFELSRQAVFGTNDATAELERRKDKTGTVSHLSTLFKESGVVMAVTLLTLLGVLVALGIALLHTRAQVRKLMVEESVEKPADRRIGVASRPRPSHGV
jgi:hypothetical protein